MIWIQGFVCLGIWVVYGWFFKNRSDQLRKQLLNRPQGLGVFLGSAGFLLGAGLLLTSLYIISALGWVGPNGLSWAGWALCSISGLVFIHLQMTGAMALVLSAARGETQTKGQTSASEIGSSTIGDEETSKLQELAETNTSR